ncbi:MAG: ATP-dependent helicase, partial [Pseudonocardia sp.]|nr:ATP-dependent helicase [Pseudonocardia sp.]
MLVLHGFWSLERGLCVWGEDSERAVTSRSQALRSARPHPFAAPVELLTDVCSGKPGEATLRLPSLAKSPLDSPELVRVTPRAAASEPVLLSWRVPTIELDPAGALAWLAAGGVEGVRRGASVQY